MVLCCGRCAEAHIYIFESMLAIECIITMKTIELSDSPPRWNTELTHAVQL